MKGSSIKVGIVEPDQAFLARLLDLLASEKDFNIIGSVTNPGDAKRMAEDGRPDVLIMSLNQRLDKSVDVLFTAFELLGTIDCRLIMISPYEDEQLILQSFSIGAVNYILKNNYQYLPTVIRMACHAFNPLSTLINQNAKLKQELMLSALSDAEREVLFLIEEGYTKRQIQEKLNKSEGTIKNQINKILKKLKVKTSKEAVQKLNRKSFLIGGVYHS